MASTYEEYIKSLNAGGSTAIPQTNPLNAFGTYKAPSTGTSNSTAPVAPKTGTQVVKQATSGVAPQSTRVPTAQTPAPQTGSQIVQQATKNATPNVTQNTNPTNGNYSNYVYNPFAGYVFGADASTSGAKGGYTPPPTLTTAQSADVAKNSGLKGLGKDNAYTGLTMAQAQAKAASDKKMYQDSTSAGTSYTYNPQSISGFNDKSKQMRTKLDTVKNDAFTSTQQKKSDADAIIKSYTSEFAGLFSTPEEFQSALTSSPEIQNSVAEYQRAGGQLSDIASNIGMKAKQNVQTLDQYLGRGSTPAEQQAYDSLIPEQKAYQDQIAFEQSVPEKYKDLYFGTPERVGILERERTIAQEKARNLEEQALKKDITDRAKAELTIQKNQAELDEELATTEQNRLSARNYSTRMLAKMGALNTTGAAVEKLTSLEQRYQAQSQKLRTAYGFKAREIEGALNETLNSNEANKQDSIIKLKEDLSKSEVEIAKEIMKLDVTASRETFKITDRYLSEYRTQKEKYVKEAKAQAEKNAKEASKIASNYDLSGFKLGDFMSKALQSGVPSPMLGARADNPMSDIDATVPQYLQSVINSGKVSFDTQAILSGKKSFYSLTQGTKNKVEKELKKLGITSDLLPEKSLSVKADTSSTASDEEFIKQLEELTK